MRPAPCTAILTALLALSASAQPLLAQEKSDDLARAQELSELRFGMFICWSFSTFGGQEWTTEPQEPDFFQATGCDTDQWCRTAKEAGMGYILFLAKHHDGFCLWDTQTTEHKVTNSPLGIDVLAKLRKSCDEHGIKLALYFSEGDWTWPGREGTRSGANPEMKKAQLEELCTQYGPIEFYWMDHATNDGGLNHEETVEWVHRFQPDCFVGFNHGVPAGRLCLREMGRPGPIGGKNLRPYGKEAEDDYEGFLIAEFTYPILPAHEGGAMWFYSLPEHDNLCHPAEKVYRDWLGAVEHGNIFSIDIGPDYAGKIRDIDVETLRQVGRYIRGEIELPPPPPPPVSSGKSASASATWKSDANFGPEQAFDGEARTRWGCAENSRSGWLAVDLGEPMAVDRAVIDEAHWNRVRRFEIQVKREDGWETIASGTTIGPAKAIDLPVTTGRRFRLNILEANEVPTIPEFQLFAPETADDR
jgi:alpha-L-fucosidase